METVVDLKTAYKHSKLKMVALEVNILRLALMDVYTK